MSSCYQYNSKTNNSKKQFRNPEFISYEDATLSRLYFRYILKFKYCTKYNEVNKHFYAYKITFYIEQDIMNSVNDSFTGLHKNIWIHYSL